MSKLLSVNQHGSVVVSRCLDALRFLLDLPKDFCQKIQPRAIDCCDQ